jgi:hypothetical protein
MSKWKPALALLLVFAAGVVLGVVGTRMVVRRVIAEMVQRPEIIPNRIELVLARRLRLDPMQRRRVNQILVESQTQMRGVRLEMQPRLLQITSNANAQISSLLNERQLRDYERLKEENRRVLQLGPMPLDSRPPSGRLGN